MKHRLFIFLFLVTFVGYNCYAQNSTRRYHVRRYDVYHPPHSFNFYSDGQFVEYTNKRSYFGIVSYGTYREKKRKFILTSDPCIMFSDSLSINSEISCSRRPVDSLIINITSPYESLLYSITAPNVAITTEVPMKRIRRVYCYDFQIVCSEDSINRAFEREFNQSHRQVCAAEVAAFKPPEVSVKEIRIKIYWNPDSGDSILKRRYPFVNTYVNVNDPSSNVYTINIPQLDYFFLSYERYKNKCIRKSGKNAIVFDKRKLLLQAPDF